MKFTKEQVEEIEHIDNIDDLLKIFIGLIYISDIPYPVLSSSLVSKVEDMLEDMLQ